MKVRISRTEPLPPELPHSAQPHAPHSSENPSPKIVMIPIWGNK